MKTNQEGKTGYDEVLEIIRRKDKENEKQVEAMEEEIEKKIKDSGKKLIKENGNRAEKSRPSDH